MNLLAKEQVNIITRNQICQTLNEVYLDQSHDESIVNDGIRICRKLT